MSEKQERMQQKMREILQDDYLTLKIEAYTMREELEAGTCRISCELRRGKDRIVAEGEGVGMVDALFGAMRTWLAEDYPSLKSIEFSQFTIRGLLSSDDRKLNTKAQAEATVGITNSSGREFIFTATAPSMSHAGVRATVAGIEYFVNSERTFVRLHEILEHYRKENRADLVQKYMGLMSEVVENTSYSEVVERIRRNTLAL
jgi:hypothetical protein